MSVDDLQAITSLTAPGDHLALQNVCKSILAGSTLPPLKSSKASDSRKNRLSSLFAQYKRKFGLSQEPEEAILDGPHPTYNQPKR